ncbi:DtxR family Mn-dependent transcriptional regulator [Crossiella equi]|uniref:Manganese transport regulator n=1 Tax=Crossiella equi TaxID=130796 RepID=A0ABS5AJA1_9PSEU|nr:metal-dependent transcriptional regulator [Crossiella equi]MBP2476659.1 DtxR family Mn-dependent transcriptional regulator [Crossiella equi]
MSVSELSESTQNYLKVVWALQEWSDEPVTTSVIAARLGLRVSTVSETVRRLTEQGLLAHPRYGSVGLTEAGRAHAVAMVRRHRLIETFLVNALNYRWDEVHDEAERLEHVVSDLLVGRMAAFLGHPTRDPHGDPIPAADGTCHRPDARQLTDIPPGTTVRVERISDSDGALLQYFADHGVHLDAELTVLPHTPFADTVTVQVPGAPVPLPLGPAAASAVWVSTPGC